MPWSIEQFPPPQDLETRKILKQVNRANKYLAELKGLAKSIPNQSILINTLTLQEAKDSSEIENIITTFEDIFKGETRAKTMAPAAKEVFHYADALLIGFHSVVYKEFLSLNHIVDIHSKLSDSTIGFRKTPGTELRNERTGETVYTPPQNPNKILEHLSVLERYINTPDHTVDKLISMALIHHQFESIHPFSDGNGRTGRIINILYLVLQGLIDIPILYLSRYITSTKDEYYRLLQHVRDSGEWEEWILYILVGVEKTAKHMLVVVQMIKEMMAVTKIKMRTELSKIYSQDLLNVIYRHPYTRTQNLIDELKISRPTAAKYLKALAAQNIVSREKIGTEVYYVNAALATLLIEIPTFGKT